MTIIRDIAGLAARAGETARVEGVYQPIDVRRDQTPPASYAGHAMLVLDDGTRVLLGAVWDPTARRSADEHTRLDGRRAIATGVVHPLGVEPPGGGAVPELPCLHPLETVTAVEGA